MNCQAIHSETRVSTVLEISFGCLKLRLFANPKAKTSLCEFVHRGGYMVRVKSEIFVSLYREIPTTDKPLGFLQTTCTWLKYCIDTF